MKNLLIFGTMMALTAQGALIDDFNSAQDACDGASCASAAFTSLLDGTVLGGERDLIATRTSISGQALLSSTNIADGVLTLSTSLGASGEGLVQWDGIDGAAGLGSLGGISLLADGSIGFLFVARDDGHTGTITIRVYDTLGGSAFVPSALPGTGVFTPYFVPFAAFVGVDLTTVRAIEMHITGAPELDAQVDFLATGIPEPGSWALIGGGLLGLGWLRRRRS